MARLTLSLLAMLVAAGIGLAAPFDRESFERELDRRGADRIEGVWQFTSDGAVIAIASTADEHAPTEPGRTYRILLISAPSRALRPGTELGTISAAAADGSYEARLYTRSEGSKLMLPRRFSLKLDDEGGYLTFLRHRSSISVNLWHFVPFLWRYSIRQNSNTGKSAQGCIRLYPQPSKPLEPRYL